MALNQENKSSSILAGYQWAIVLTLGLTLFLGVIGGGFYLYVLDREQYYNDRYFRLLNSQASALNQRIDNYKAVLYSAGNTSSKAFGHAATNKEDSVIETMHPRRALECLKSQFLGFALDVGLQLCQVPDFYNVNVTPQRLSMGIEKNISTSITTSGDPAMPATHAVESVSAHKGTKASSSETSQNPNKQISDLPFACPTREEYDGLLRLVQSNSSPDFWVETTWHSTRSIFVVGALIPHLIRIGNACAPINWRISAEVDAENLFNQTLLDRSFDDLLLINKKGNILFQVGESGLPLARTDLLFPEDKGRSSDTKGEAATKDDVRTNDTNVIKKVPVRQEVSIAGKIMYVFALPLNLPIVDKVRDTPASNSEEGRNYILVGLVSKEKFRNETWQLSPSVLLMILLVALVTLLILPLLKLISTAPQDQWSLRDFNLVVGAGIVGTGLLTLALVDAGAFWWTKDRAGNALEAFAESMARNVNKEIDDAIGQLNSFDRIKAASDSKVQKCYEVDADVLGKNLITTDKPLYKDFTSVFWVNYAGDLCSHLDISRAGTDSYVPLVTNLSDRAYFRNIINHRYWHRKNVHVPFALETIYSRTDGSNTAVVAVQSKVKFENSAVVVAGLESRLLSLFEPIVPPGLGFAVVDGSNGKVLFHSQGQRNLREKFFEETDNNKKLKALITSRAQGCEDGTYGGNSHYFCVRAFEDIPWALVVFRNMEPLRTANLEAVTVASVLYMIYSLVFLLVIIGGISICKIYRQSVPVWLWPSKDWQTQYVTSTLVMVVLLVIGTVLLLLLPPEPAFIVGVIILPTIGILVTLLIFKWPVVQELRLLGPIKRFIVGLGNTIGIRGAYVVLGGNMLALCSVLPATVCMTLSYEGEQTFLSKAGALDLAKSFAKSADQIRERYQFYKDDRIISARLYGETTQPLDSRTAPWCPRRLDNSTRRDVHFPPPEVGWLNTILPSSFDFIVCEQKGSDKGRDGLVRDTGDWFEKTYRFLRVPFNDEFTRTQGLFSKSQKSEDIHWYIFEDVKMVSYMPVHDLKRLDDSNGSERWNVAFTHRPWSRLPGIILLGFVIGGMFAVYRKRVAHSDTAFSFLISSFGIAAVSILVLFLIWPGETLSVIAVLLPLLFFAYLIHMLPGFVARRVFLLDLVPPETDRSNYVNKLRKSSAFSTFTEDEEKAFEEEFGVSQELCEIGQAILENSRKRDDFKLATKSIGFDPKAIAIFACDEARLRYDDIWASMSNDQKLALFHLAKSGFINREHPGLLSLFKTGWILLSPQLRYVNESFRQFVLSQKEEVIMLRYQLPGGVWSQLVGPLGFGMVFILAGLMYTQQDLLTGITALVGVLAGLVPVISKLLDLFKNQKVNSSAS